MSIERSVRRVCAAVAALLPALGAPHALADEPAKLTAQASARLTAVDGPDRLTAGRGTAEGLTAGTSVTIHPVRASEEGKSAEPEFDITLGEAIVTEAGPHSASIKLTRRLSEIRPGDMVLYAVEMPPAWADDALFTAAAHDTCLVSMTGAPLYAFAALLADREAARRGAVLDALVADVKGNAELAESSYTKRIEGGRFHGKLLGEVFRAVTRADLAAMLDYLDAYSGTYAARDIKATEIFASWAVAGGDGAERVRAERKAAPLRQRGDAAAARGDITAAEEAYRAALALVPGQDTLRERLDRMVSIRLRRERLAHDPDDTATRWDLFLALYNSEAFDLSAAELTLLEKAGYDADLCLRYRGYLAVRQKRFAEAVPLLRRLAARVKDAGLDGWIRFAEARARLVEQPGSFDARLAVARVHEDDHEWNLAIDAYGEAEGAAGTPEQKQLAVQGRERIAMLKEAERYTATAKGLIEQHQLGDDLVSSVNSIVELCKKVDVATCLPPRAAELAESARSVFEYELALTLLRSLAELSDTSSAWADLAFAQQGDGRLADALESAGKAVAREPKTAYALSMRARILLAQGDLAHPAEDAAAATALDAAYAWPQQVAAQIAAARGEWDAAARLVTRARDLEPDRPERTRVFSAIQLGRLAAAEIAAGKDVARNRLRLVRAFARAEMFPEALREAAKLEGTPHAAAAYWAIAVNDSSLLGLDDQLRALQLAGATTPLRRQRLEVIQARQAVAAEPAAPAARLRLARAWIAAGGFHRALVALGGLAWSDDAASRDVAELARRGNRAWEQYEIARNALRREDRATAAQLLEQVAAEYRAVGSTSDVLAASYLRAISLGALPGRQKEALALYDTLIQTAREYGDDDTLHGASVARGQLLTVQGSLEPLVKAQRDSLEYARAEDDIVSEVGLLSTLSYIASDAGRMREAIDAANEGLRKAALCGDRVNERSLTFALGDHQFSLGNLGEARRLADVLLAASRAARDAYNERQALVLLGAVEMAMGDAKSALPHLEEMYELGRRVGSNPDRGLARLFQGRTLLYVAGDPKGAAERFAQAADIYRTVGDAWDEGRALLGLGEARVALKDAKGAIEALTIVRDRSRESKRQTEEAYASVELAHAELLAGHAEPARVAALAAQTIAAATELSDLQWQSAYALGRALEAAGKLDDAVAAYERAATVLAEEMGRATSDATREAWLGFGRRRQVFRDTIDLLIRTGRTDRAMEITQLSRDAQLRAKLGAHPVQAQNPALQQTLDGVGDAQAKANAAKKALNDELAKPEDQRDKEKVRALSEVAAKSEGELRQLLLRLKRDHRRLYSMLAFSPESVGEVRDALPEDVLVVQYFVTEESTYIFTLRKDRTRTRAVKVPVKSSDLGDAVFEFVSALKAELPRAAELGAQIYGWLLAPVEDEMATARTTLVVPFGGLHYLPFHALGTKDAAGEMHYAIERFRIGYLSSTTLFKLQKAQRSSAEGTLLAFANPDGSLPGAHAEVEHVVAEGYRGAKVLYEAEARKKQFFDLAGGYRILHFATHGIVTTDPAASFLKMSDAELTVNEIMGFEGLEGKTDLVVLSACQTAMEKGQSTEDEPISIASAFATAGAPTLVASLWSVNDESTSELMRRFYAGLAQRKGELDTLEALRRAQLGVMSVELNGGRPFAAPRYWAAFELVGDYR